MKRSHLATSWIAASALAAALGSTRHADACGACFAPPTDDTQVSGHRMVMSISKTQTTLYDQFSYTGNPSSFAWVLPVRFDGGAPVDFDISADIFFQTLDADTKVTVLAPPYTCPEPPPGCYPGGYYGEGDNAGSPSAGGGGASSVDAGVTVVSQKTVGPYETVQISATDPQALETWLVDHGYVIPADVQPVVDAYVREGFGFLALKLVPGKDVTSMRPVRVKMSAGGTTLPLRMVAGGTGAVVPITLWVVSEGAYEPANFPTFTVATSDVVWDYSAYSSNYADLRTAGYQASGGIGWLDEASIALSPQALESSIEQYIQMGNHDYDPETPDGGTPTTTAVDALKADMAALFDGMLATSVHVTRLRAELPRKALGADLTLQVATAEHADVSNVVQATKSLHDPPCPDYSWCSQNVGISDALGTTRSSSSSDGPVPACSAAPRGRGALAGGSLAAVAALAVALGRRARRASRKR